MLKHFLYASLAKFSKKHQIFDDLNSLLLNFIDLSKPAEKDLITLIWNVILILIMGRIMSSSF